MRYSLSAFYKDYVKEKILKDFLKSGKIPTENQINSKLTEAIASSGNFRFPMLSSVNSLIENGETSSASKVNQTFKALESDLNICVNAIMDQESKVSSLYDTTFSKFAGLQNKIKLIKQDVDKILFESKNTDIHEELFYEKFDSQEMVDKINTNAAVDISLREVLLKSTEQYPINLSSSINAIEVVVGSNPKIINSNDIGEMHISNITKGNNKVWMHQVSASEALSSVTVDVIIRTPSLQTEINKIVLDPYSVDLKTQVNVEIFHSKDGLNWVVPNGESRKRLDNLTALSFTGLKSEYWRIRFTKFGNDGFFSNFYVYNFGLRSLAFYGKTYNKISRLDLGYLYSKPIMFKNIVKMANVKVCENKPPKTSIKYSMAPIYESDVPAIANGTKSPLDLNYYPLNLTDKSSATLDFLSVSSFPIINDLVLNETIDYKDKKDYDFCLDTILPSNYAKSQTILLRNALNQDTCNAIGREDLLKQTGWNFDGSYYSTYVFVEDHDGVVLDLGSTEMYINNTKVQGRAGLKQGLNFVVTHRDNWKTLDLNTLPVEADQIIDPLYPYNHKYIIEGIGQSLYGRDTAAIIEGKTLADIIDKDNVYRRASRECWSIKMAELDFNTFASKTKNELDVFSYKIDNTNQERIVVKSNPDIGLINNERFSIITKLHSAENIKGLIFKAVLETEDNKVSPVLTEYLVKIK